MAYLGAALRSGVFLAGIGLLAACQGAAGSADRNFPGVLTTPGVPGATGAGSPVSNAARAVNQTPPVFDDNRGAPL